MRTSFVFFCKVELIPVYFADRRKLFDAELSKLRSSGMDEQMATDLRESIALEHETAHFHDQPILSTDEDNDSAIIEERYEIAFQGETPPCIVGLELDNGRKNAYDSRENWHLVIEGLANRMAERGELSVRMLHNLARHEKKQSALAGRKKHRFF